MKKELKVISYPDIKEFKPLLFWQVCRFCKNTFIREIGYKITDKKTHWNIGEDPFYSYYCCKDCAKDEKELLDLIKKYKPKSIFEIIKERELKEKKMKESILSAEELTKYSLENIPSEVMDELKKIENLMKANIAKGYLEVDCISSLLTIHILKAKGYNVTVLYCDSEIFSAKIEWF